MMKITDAKFIISVADKSKFYSSGKPLIAVAGKSNVGKSSLINMLAGQKKLAKTSAEPGRTRLVNYFDFGDFTLADLPGYGFAKVSKAEKDKWAELLEDFFATQKIDLLLVLVDIRHAPSVGDIEMINYAYHYAVPFSVIATKSDKLPKTKIKPRLMEIAAEMRLGIGDVTCSSAEKGVGKGEILSLIEKAALTKD